MKRLKSSVALAFMLLMPALGLAHAHLEKSVPAANSSVASMPAEIVLQFSEAVRLTALGVRMEGAKDKTELKPPASSGAQVKVQAPRLLAGTYLLEWRGLSDDGHVMNGVVRFTVTGK